MSVVRTDTLADTLIVGVGAVLVAAGGYGVSQQIPIVWVDDPAPEWWGMALWALGIGLLMCAAGLVLGMRGRGFTSLPASAGSLVGTLVAVVLLGKLVVRDVQLSRGITCQVQIAGVQHLPEAAGRKPYLITAAVGRVVEGSARPDYFVFRLQHAELVHVGRQLQLTYTRPLQWTDLRTWFRRRVRHALEDAVAVSFQ